MKAFVFPGQGAQFVGMGKDLYENNPVAKEMFDKANEILGFNITDLMFNGTASLCGYCQHPWLRFLPCTLADDLSRGGTYQSFRSHAALQGSQ